MIHFKDGTKIQGTDICVDELDEVAQADLQLPDPEDDETLIALGVNIASSAKLACSAEKV